uniref:Uncharacterized protein n=1 Tax=Romanomermis culicivorax TaxID=13658 RepID=A0A915JR65_ROMCU
GHPVCEFDVEKINQDKVAALFKIREVDNRKGNQFFQYISFVLMNGQTYVIHFTGLTEKEWTVEEKDSMEAKMQQQEIEDEKIQTQIDEAATKMWGIDVRLDKMQETSQEIPVQPKDAKAHDLQAKREALQAKIAEQKCLVQQEFLCPWVLQKKLKEQSYADDSSDSVVAATELMKRGRIYDEGIPDVYSPEKVQQMMAEGMSERFI